MSRSLKLIPALPALALAALVFVAPAARAATTMYPGSICNSDGPQVHDMNGSVYNNNGSNSTGYQVFNCPIPRRLSTGVAVDVSLRARINMSSADYYCVLRAVSVNGDVLNSNSYTLPNWAFLSNNTGAFTMNMTVSAGFGAWYPVLRCRVPNKASGSTAAIVSLTVEE